MLEETLRLHLGQPGAGLPMIHFFQKLFSADFMPHVFCLRSPGLIWLHAVSDGCIALAYLLIPLGLLQLVRRRRDLAFHWLFVLFAIFILSCGATHILAIVTLWTPIYRFDGLIKVVTAISSLLTAFILIRLIPSIATLPRADQWRRANEELKLEIVQRKNAEASMRHMNQALEQRVEERTRELADKNRILQNLTVAWDMAHGLIRNQEGIINFWCQGSQTLYGFSKEEALGKSSHQLLQTIFPRPLLEIDRELREKGSWSGELVHTTKAGSLIRVATHWALQANRDAAALLVIEVNNDITDRIRADEASERLANIVESSYDPIIGTDLNGNVTTWNQSAELLFGYTATEMLGSPANMLTPAFLLNEEMEAVLEIGRTKSAKQFETVRITHTGQHIDVALTISPILNSSSQVTGASMIVRDISEARRQAEAVRVSEERQRLAMEAGQVGIWYVELETGHSIWSRRCKELHGIHPDTEVKPYPFALELIHPEDRERVESDFTKIATSRGDLATEYRTRGVDGKIKWVQSWGRVYCDPHGKVIGAHGAVIDLTTRREIEDKLRRAHSELEQFTYAAAHDLQEPLRNVSLAAEILRSSASGVNTLQEPRMLGVMIDNAQRMEAMVKDLLAYSRALDSLDQPVESIDANHVLARILKLMDASVMQNRAIVTSDVLPLVSMQEQHLVQILQNLIGNALKYGAVEPLLIHVGLRRRGSDVLLFVKDNGVGIASQYHERAFRMFKRLHSGSATGTGIGLAVCKRIVEHYGGQIWIESELGQGAAFFFSVPVTTA